MSGRIPQHFIDDLVARADIIDVIGSRVPLRKAGKEWKACCPFHDEKSPSFTVVPEKQFYHCFGCGAHGTVLGFLMDYDHLSFVEAVEDLAGRVGVEVPREQDVHARPKPVDDLYDLLERVALWYRDQLSRDERARTYANHRHLEAATLATFGIGYAPGGWDALLKQFGTTPETQQRLLAGGLVIERPAESQRRERYYDRFRERLMFPIRDSRGRTIGFGGRVVDEGEPKYLNSPETELFHKGRELYGLYEARQGTRRLTRLLVVEGYMDVVRLHQAGITYAVATLGTATTPDHLTRIFRICSEVVFCFDGDRAGRGAAWRALENALPQVKEGRQIRFLFLPEGEDPDSLVGREGRSAFERRLDEADSLSTYLLRELAAHVDARTVDGRAQLAERARPLLERMPDGVFRALLIEELAAVIGLPTPRLQALLGMGPAGPPSDRSIERNVAGPRHYRHAHRPPLAGRGNFVRQAIRILTHHPSLAGTVRIPDGLDQVHKPGIDVLNQLLADRPPCTTTGMLLERWRQSPHYRNLARLAQEEFLNDPAAAEGELAAALNRLVEEDRARQRTALLLAKQGTGTLSADERKELQSLLSAPKSADTGSGTPV